MDLHRASAFLATNGADGRSPHLAVDVVTLLTRRGHTVTLHKANLSSMDTFALEMDVDEFKNIRVVRHRAKASPIFYVFNGPSTVSVHAGRIVFIPHDVTPCLQKDWRNNWPGRFDLTASSYLDVRSAEYVQRVMGKAPEAPKRRLKLGYFSETAIVGAIELSLRETPIRASVAHPRDTASTTSNAAQTSTAPIFSD